uniref:Uncharacterized protein n=1 Tax=Caenorhabditis japonica TaxID=281687 RepID=A0A8R1EFY5_CAEJA
MPVTNTAVIQSHQQHQQQYAKMSTGAGDTPVYEAVERGSLYSLDYRVFISALVFFLARLLAVFKGASPIVPQNRAE